MCADAYSVINNIVMDNVNFSAIDFETATKTTRMPCQVGLVVVRGGRIVHEISELIRPPRNYHSKELTEIHGITKKSTEKAPDFKCVWDRIKPFLERGFVVAHNAAFDMSVLKAACKYYGIPEPVFMGTACTYALSGQNLKDACARNNIELGNHHDALSDARACAGLFQKYLMTGDIMCSSTSERPIRRIEYTLRGAQLGKDLSCADPNHVLYDKSVVITGVFQKWSRSELAALLKREGANLKSGFSDRVDFLVVGEMPGPAKMQHARQLIGSGHGLKILRESDLNRMLRDTPI